MKILVMSDTHRMIKYADRVLKGFENKIDGFIHLGDCIDDAYELHRRYNKLRFWVVKGNCDYTEGRIYTVADIEGRRIYICHGHREDVRYDRLRLVYSAKEHNCVCALYGHTHIGDIDSYGGVDIFNPGSLSMPRDGLTKTFGLLDITKDKISAEILGIDSDGYKTMMKGLT